MLSKGMASLREFKAETGLTAVAIAGLLETPLNTVSKWLSEKGPAPSNDGLLHLAVKQARQEYAAKIVKGKVQDDPRCPCCGETMHLSEVKRGYFTVSHRCLSGLTIKIPARPKDEVLYALTSIVRPK